MGFYLCCEDLFPIPVPICSVVVMHNQCPRSHGFPDLTLSSFRLGLSSYIQILLLTIPSHLPCTPQIDSFKQQSQAAEAALAEASDGAVAAAAAGATAATAITDTVMADASGSGGEASAAPPSSAPTDPTAQPGAGEAGPSSVLAAGPSSVAVGAERPQPGVAGPSSSSPVPASEVYRKAAEDLVSELSALPDSLVRLLAVLLGRPNLTETAYQRVGNAIKHLIDAAPR